MKKWLIIGIILLICSLGLFIYDAFIDKPVNMYEITNKGLKDIDKKVYIDATFVAGTITGNNDKSYYVMFGDGVQYIIYIDNKEANKINRYLLDNPDSSYRIEGVTKLIPESMEENGKKFVKEWLDHSHNHTDEVEEHSHDITTDEFYHYFGYVYLDVVDSFNFVRLFIYLTGITGILFIINYLNTKYHFIG
jgi:hypothetical protein